VRTRKKF